MYRIAVTIAFFLTLTGCDTLRHAAEGGSDPLASDDKATMEMHGIRAVSDLPPVIPQARGRVSVDNVVGPQTGHIAWNVALPFTSMPTLIDQIGVDGTVFVSGYDGVGAVQDGKLLWAYKVNAPEDFGLSSDGAIWFTKSGTAQWFSLNSKGEGGLLPRTFQRPLDIHDAPRVGCSGNMRAVRIEGHDVGLDYECTRPQAIMGPDHIVYAGTDAPDMRAFTAAGALLWKAKTPCDAETMLIGPGGRVFFSCKDHSVHFMLDGALRWSLPGDGDIQEPNNNPPHSSMTGVMDRNGNVYYADTATGGIGTHIHAISAAGKELWTIKTAMFSVASMNFDGHGHILISGQRGMAPRVFSIAD